MRCSSSEYQPCQADVGNPIPGLEPQGQVVPVCFQPMETASTGTCCQHRENSLHLMVLLWWLTEIHLEGVIRGESFQANSIMNQCITSSSFLSLWYACCLSWVKCCWEEGEGREDLKEARQEDPDMNLSHPQNACINWSLPVQGKPQHANKQKAKHHPHPLIPQQNNNTANPLIVTSVNSPWCDWFHPRNGQISVLQYEHRGWGCCRMCDTCSTLSPPLEGILRGAAGMCGCAWRGAQPEMWGWHHSGVLDGAVMAVGNLWAVSHVS